MSDMCLVNKQSKLVSTKACLALSVSFHTRPVDSKITQWFIVLCNNVKLCWVQNDYSLQSNRNILMSKVVLGFAC